MTQTRREILQSAARNLTGASLLGLTGAASSTAQAGFWQKNTTIPFGAAVSTHHVRDDAAFRRALIGHCQMLVPEGALKWFDLRPAPDVFDFADADLIVDFARQNGRTMRGHTLVWYAAMPDWAKRITQRHTAEYELSRHIDIVVGRYRGVIPSWDVVNEPISDDPAGLFDIRASVWSQTLGRSYVETAFRRAAAADPNAHLIINEYDIEFVGPRFRAKRDALRRLIFDLKDRDVPIHGIGLQSHLRGPLTIDREGISQFVADMNGIGLDILVTELDVIDHKLPGPFEIRDAIIAARAYDLLEAVFEVVPPKAILTWGLSDRYSWISHMFPRGDGFENRPLPFDKHFQPKPLWHAIQHFRQGGA